MTTNAMLPAVGNQDDRLAIDYSADNPQTENIDEIPELVSEDDKAKLVTIATNYRTGWAPARLLRLATWGRNELVFRGCQILGYDRSQGVYYDALAYYMQSNESQDGDDTYLERRQFNITKMLGTAFVGTMSRSVPPTAIVPENADIEADVTTATAGQEAISIIERMNDIDGLVRGENTMLYNYGMYAKRTHVVIDGNWAGWDKVPDIQPVTTMLPNRYHCSRCGKDTPADEQGGASNQIAQQGSEGNSQTDGQDFSGTGNSGRLRPPSAMATPNGAINCIGCAAPLGSADFYPAEALTQDVTVGTKRKARAMVKWTIHPPLEFDADPQAKKVKNSPVVALDREVDVGWARRTFSGMRDKIKQGMSTSTTPNAEYERMRRNESYSPGYAFTTDSFLEKCTYSEVWIQPDAYYHDQCDEKDQSGLTFSERMMKAGPDGLRLQMIGKEVVGVQPACVEKEWTTCVLIEECGLYPPSIADDVVPINLAINGAMDIMDEYFERCSSGLVIADAAKLDKREMQGKQMVPGTLNWARTTGPGGDKPLSEALMQFSFNLDQNLFQYVPMLWNYAELIAGLPPQTFGVGTQQNVETAKGQAQQLDTAQTKLNIFFENEKVEHAQAAQNAIEALQKAGKQGLIKEIWDVIESNGSEFRNNYVDLGKMNGRVRVYPKADSGLPQSPEQLRQVYTTIVTEAGEGNPLALEVMDAVPNQELIMASLCGDGFVLPAADQLARTSQHINILLEAPSAKVVDPATNQLVENQNPADLPVKPEIGTDDWKTLQSTIKQFKQKNWDIQKSNSDGWARLNQYQQLAKQMEIKEAADEATGKKSVMQAGAPDPNPDQAAAQKLLLQDGAQAVQDLATIAAIPPAIAIPGKALPAVVSAAGKIIDSAVKATKK